MLRQTGHYLILLFCLTIAAPVIADSSDSQKKQLDNLRKRIGGLRDELNVIRGEHSQVRNELQETELKINKFVTTLKSLSRNIRQQNNELVRLKKDKARYQKDMSTQLDLLAIQVRSAYAIGRQEYLKLLLNQEHPETVGRVLRYYQYFNEERSSRVLRAEKIVEKLNQVSKAINRKVVQLKGLRKKQRSQKGALENTKRARNLVLARLKSELLNKGEELEHLIQNEQKLARLIKEINEVMPEIQMEPGKHLKFAKLKGKLYWPTVGIVKKLFGKSRKSKKLKWNGVIIKAKSGMNVRSISRGRVAYADWLRGYGLLVIIDHGDGYMSLYGRNESIQKETGDWVEANEVIASVGDSGGNEFTGLYFEIRYNGKPINPTQWCKKTRRL
ncbi:Murein hydrolase activator EnvC [hydrothermal vent metagenome]|uniref:Murein hydrolase activator EnvC n=1 Tax=hydrothermal vent metagenome TaxID=652676 RepID=A0A3B0ZKA6_9ZZZZ